MRLVVVEGHSAGRTIRLRRRPATIGRYSANTIALDDARVSRRHAAIQWQNGAFVIQDLGSRNGTYVNAQRLRGPKALRAGDRIQIGDTRLVVQGESRRPRGDARDWVEWGQQGHDAWEEGRDARERGQDRRLGRQAQPRYSPRPPLAESFGKFISTLVSSPLFPLMAAGIGAVIAAVSTRGGPASAPASIPVEQALGTGDVQITLQWNNTADLDLHVVDPDGEEIYFDHDRSASGGELDVDANADCSGSSSSPVENIFWPYGEAPEGRYKVFVVYYSECNNEGPTSWQVRTKVDGRTHSFSGTVNFQGERDDVTTFTR